MISNDNQDCSNATPVIVVLSKVIRTPSMIKETTVIKIWMISIQSEAVDKIDIDEKAPKVQTDGTDSDPSVQYYP